MQIQYGNVSQFKRTVTFIIRSTYMQEMKITVEEPFGVTDNHNEC